MDPTLGFGQAFSVSGADLRALDLIGWDLNTAAGPEIAVPIPPALPLLLTGVAALFAMGRLRNAETGVLKGDG